jgi:heme-degrading monooxygenase HmoA
MNLASTPEPPYYAVIFTSIRSPQEEGYERTAEEMAALAATMPGFLGMESARENIGITVSYWRSLDDISHWRNHAEHKIAQRFGREKWYAAFTTRICLVERAYSFVQKTPHKKIEELP